MTEERRQITGHILACGTQIMWGATFVSTKVLLNYFLPAEVLFTRAVLAFLALLIFYPHHLKLKNPRQELAFAGAGLFGIVLYFMLILFVNRKLFPLRLGRVDDWHHRIGKSTVGLCDTCREKEYG